LIQRGDIRWFRFDVPDKRRPVVVLGNDLLLPTLSQVPVIPLSTQIRGLPWEVALSTEEGLPSPCVLKPEWIKSVERAFLGPRITSFPEARWAEVRASLLLVLGLETS
jgi:mRNA-degrading endonuclease toxin of MazEF toxin-antitoxin module